MNESVSEEVLDRVRPSPDERRRLNERVEELCELVGGEARRVGVEADAVLVGSTSRGTWLSGDRDIDVFIKLPPSLEREEFVELGLEVARGVANVGDYSEEAYAEHPYVRARFAEFDVDLVPCFDVEDAEEIRSAVDRTPFHDAYLDERLGGLEDEVLLLKQFMKGTGVYSAETRVRGFSGYLSELLVLIHGGFGGVLEAASGWSPGESYDPEGHGTAGDYGGPLVVVDPVDPGRNVSAALSLQRFAEFVQAAGDYLEEARREFFFPPEPRAGTGFDERGTFPLVVEVEVEEGIVEDNLFPQLRKTRDSLVRGLESTGLRVLRSGVYRDRIVMELFEEELPRAERHEGPPVWLREHAEKFLEKYGSERLFSGPWVGGDGHLVVEKRRTETGAVDALKRLLDEGKGFGRAIARRGGFEVHAGVEARDEVPDDFVSRTLPWRRGGQGPE
ncbi:MAG: CCA-adding enzyme [Methanonatronarchaeales archaeon]|nr:CCA-adding enzyme [Methanonatronarchaeales archaeon]